MSDENMIAHYCEVEETMIMVEEGEPCNWCGKISEQSNKEQGVIEYHDCKDGARGLIEPIVYKGPDGRHEIARCRACGETIYAGHSAELYGARARRLLKRRLARAGIEIPPAAVDSWDYLHAICVREGVTTTPL